MFPHRMRVLIVGIPGILILLLLAWVYFHFNGGMPWGRSIAQDKINDLLKQKSPHQTYTVQRAYYDFKQDVDTVGVMFPKYPNDVFVIKLEGSDLKYWVTIPAPNVKNPQTWNDMSVSPP